MRNQIQIVVIAALVMAMVACSPSKDVSVNADAGPVRQTAPPAHAVAAPALVAKTYTLVMLGDSLTAGFGLAPDDAFSQVVETDMEARTGPRIRIVNAGVSGDTSTSGLARFDWSVGPDANGVFIALGANDMLNGLDPAKTRQNLIAMIEKARVRKLDVFLAGLRASNNLGVGYGREFDRIYADISQKYCVPLFGFLLQPLANNDGTAINQELIQGDGLHPTKEGAARIGHALSGWLDTALSTPHIPCTPDVR